MPVKEITKEEAEEIISSKVDEKPKVTEEKKVTPKQPVPYSEQLEAKVRLLQMENEELKTKLEGKTKQEEFMGLPVMRGPLPDTYLPNFEGMTQQQLGQFAKDYDIDIKQCSRAFEIVDTLKRAWREKMVEMTVSK